jgi:hypothetical protein
MSEQSTVPLKSSSVIKDLPASASDQTIPAEPEIAKNAVSILANYMRLQMITQLSAPTKACEAFFQTARAGPPPGI